MPQDPNDKKNAVRSLLEQRMGSALQDGGGSSSRGRFGRQQAPSGAAPAAQLPQQGYSSVVGKGSGLAGETHPVADFFSATGSALTMGIAPRDSLFRALIPGEQSEAYIQAVRERVAMGGFSKKTQQIFSSAGELVGMSLGFILESLVLKGMGKAFAGGRAIRAAKTADDLEKALKGASFFRKSLLSASPQSATTLSKMGVDSAHMMELLTFDHISRDLVRHLSPTYALDEKSKRFLRSMPGATYKGRIWDPEAQDFGWVQPGGEITHNAFEGVAYQLTHGLGERAAFSGMTAVGKAVMSAGFSYTAQRAARALRSNAEIKLRPAIAKKLGIEAESPQAALAFEEAWASFAASDKFAKAVMNEASKSRGIMMGDMFQAYMIGTVAHKISDESVSWVEAATVGGLSFMLGHIGNKAIGAKLGLTKPLVTKEEGRKFLEIMNETGEEFQRLVEESKMPTEVSPEAVHEASKEGVNREGLEADVEGYRRVLEDMSPTERLERVANANPDDIPRLQEALRQIAAVEKLPKATVDVKGERVEGRILTPKKGTLEEAKTWNIQLPDGSVVRRVKRNVTQGWESENAAPPKDAAPEEPVPVAEAAPRFGGRKRKPRLLDENTPPSVEEVEAAIARSKGAPVISKNAEKKGIEISFPVKPNAKARAAMKAAGFRWNRSKRVWYARDDNVKAIEFVKQLEATFEGVEPASVEPKGPKGPKGLEGEQAGVSGATPKKRYITRQDLRDNPEKIYIFGDNDSRSGLGGQAKAMRGEPNAVGIRTKKTPSRDDAAYYTDAELAENKKKIDEDMAPLFAAKAEGRTIIIPASSIGTGFAKLKEKAPKTYEYLQQRLKKLGPEKAANLSATVKDPRATPAVKATEYTEGDAKNIVIRNGEFEIPQDQANYLVGAAKEAVRVDEAPRTKAGKPIKRMAMKGNVIVIHLKSLINIMRRMDELTLGKKTADFKPKHLGGGVFIGRLSIPAGYRVGDVGVPKKQKAGEGAGAQVNVMLPGAVLSMMGEGTTGNRRLSFELNDPRRLRAYATHLRQGAEIPVLGIWDGKRVRLVVPAEELLEGSIVGGKIVGEGQRRIYQERRQHVLRKFKPEEGILRGLVEGELKETVEREKARVEESKTRGPSVKKATLSALLDERREVEQRIKDASLSAAEIEGLRAESKRLWDEADALMEKTLGKERVEADKKKRSEILSALGRPGDAESGYTTRAQFEKLKKEALEIENAARKELGQEFQEKVDEAKSLAGRARSAEFGDATLAANRGWLERLDKKIAAVREMSIREYYEQRIIDAENELKRFQKLPTLSEWVEKEQSRTAFSVIPVPWTKGQVAESGGYAAKLVKEGVLAIQDKRSLNAAIVVSMRGEFPISTGPEAAGVAGAMRAGFFKLRAVLEKAASGKQWYLGVSKALDPMKDGRLEIMTDRDGAVYYEMGPDGPMPRVKVRVWGKASFEEGADYFRPKGLVKDKPYTVTFEHDGEQVLATMKWDGGVNYTAETEASIPGHVLYRKTYRFMLENGVFRESGAVKNLYGMPRAVMTNMLREYARELQRYGKKMASRNVPMGDVSIKMGDGTTVVIPPPKAGADRRKADQMWKAIIKVLDREDLRIERRGRQEVNLLAAMNEASIEGKPVFRWVYENVRADLGFGKKGKAYPYERFLDEMNEILQEVMIDPKTKALDVTLRGVHEGPDTRPALEKKLAILEARKEKALDISKRAVTATKKEIDFLNKFNAERKFWEGEVREVKQRLAEIETTSQQRKAVSLGVLYALGRKSDQFEQQRMERKLFGTGTEKKKITEDNEAAFKAVVRDRPALFQAKKSAKRSGRSRMFGLGFREGLTVIALERAKDLVRSEAWRNMSIGERLEAAYGHGFTPAQAIRHLVLSYGGLRTSGKFGLLRSEIIDMAKAAMGRGNKRDRDTTSLLSWIKIPGNVAEMIGLPMTEGSGLRVTDRKIGGKVVRYLVPETEFLKETADLGVSYKSADGYWYLDMAKVWDKKSSLEDIHKGVEDVVKELTDPKFDHGELVPLVEHLTNNFFDMEAGGPGRAFAADQYGSETGKKIASLLIESTDVRLAIGVPKIARKDKTRHLTRIMARAVYLAKNNMLYARDVVRVDGKDYEGTLYDKLYHEIKSAVGRDLNEAGLEARDVLNWSIGRSGMKLREMDKWVEHASADLKKRVEAALLIGESKREHNVEHEERSARSVFIESEGEAFQIVTSEFRTRLEDGTINLKDINDVTNVLARFIKDKSEGDDALAASIRQRLRFKDKDNTYKTDAGLISEISDWLRKNSTMTDSQRKEMLQKIEETGFILAGARETSEAIASFMNTIVTNSNIRRGDHYVLGASGRQFSESVVQRNLSVDERWDVNVGRWEEVHAENKDKPLVKSAKTPAQHLEDSALDLNTLVSYAESGRTFGFDKEAHGPMSYYYRGFGSDFAKEFGRHDAIDIGGESGAASWLAPKIHLAVTIEQILAKAGEGSHLERFLQNVFFEELYPDHRSIRTDKDVLDYLEKAGEKVKELVEESIFNNEPVPEALDPYAVGVEKKAFDLGTTAFREVAKMTHEHAGELAHQYAVNQAMASAFVKEGGQISFRNEAGEYVPISREENQAVWYWAKMRRQGGDFNEAGNTKEGARMIKILAKSNKETGRPSLLRWDAESGKWIPRLDNIHDMLKKMDALNAARLAMGHERGNAGCSCYLNAYSSFLRSIADKEEGLNRAVSWHIGRAGEAFRKGFEGWNKENKNNPFGRMGGLIYRFGESLGNFMSYLRVGTAQYGLEEVTEDIHPQIKKILQQAHVLSEEWIHHWGTLRDLLTDQHGRMDRKAAERLEFLLWNYTNDSGFSTLDPLTLKKKPATGKAWANKQVARQIEIENLIGKEFPQLKHLLETVKMGLALDAKVGEMALGMAKLAHSERFLKIATDSIIPILGKRLSSVYKGKHLRGRYFTTSGEGLTADQDNIGFWRRKIPGEVGERSIDSEVIPLFDVGTGRLADQEMLGSVFPVTLLHSVSAKLAGIELAAKIKYLIERHVIPEDQITPEMLAETRFGSSAYVRWNGEFDRVISPFQKIWLSNPFYKKSRLKEWEKKNREGADAFRVLFRESRSKKRLLGGPKGEVEALYQKLLHGYIPRDLFFDMREMVETATGMNRPEGIINQVAGRLGGSWAISKTVLRPKHYVTTFFSMWGLNHMYGGMPLSLFIPYFKRGFEEIKNDGLYFREQGHRFADKSLLNDHEDSDVVMGFLGRTGLDRARYLNRDVMEMENIISTIQESAKNMPDVLGRVGQAITRTGQEAFKFYRNMELAGKMALYIYLREGGMGKDEAWRRASFATVDAHTNPAFLKHLSRGKLAGVDFGRLFGIKFQSWRTRVLPTMVESMWKRPVTMAKLALVAGATQTMLAKLWGYNDDDMADMAAQIAKEQGWMGDLTGTSYMRSRFTNMPLPKTSTGRFRSLDMWHFIPFEDVTGYLLSPSFQPLTSIIEGAAGHTFGRYKQELRPEGAYAHEKIAQTALYEASQFLPLVTEVFATAGKPQKVFHTDRITGIDDMGPDKWFTDLVRSWMLPVRTWTPSRSLGLDNEYRNAQKEALFLGQRETLLGASRARGRVMRRLASISRDGGPEALAGAMRKLPKEHLPFVMSNVRELLLYSSKHPKMKQFMAFAGMDANSYMRAVMKLKKSFSEEDVPFLLSLGVYKAHNSIEVGSLDLGLWKMFREVMGQSTRRVK